MYFVESYIVNNKDENKKSIEGQLEDELNNRRVEGFKVISVVFISRAVIESEVYYHNEYTECVFMVVYEDISDEKQ